MNDQDKTAKAPEAQGEKVEAKPQAAPEKANQNSGGEALSAIKKQLSERDEQNKELREKLDLIERQQVEKSGDLKKILKLEQEAKAKLKNEYDSLKAQVIEAKIKEAISEKAKDAHDVGSLLKLGDVSKLTVADGKVFGADEFVNEARNAMPYLFKIQDVNAGPKVGPSAPKTGVKNNEEYLKKLDTVKTASDLANLRKEYGVDSGADKVLHNGQLQVQ